MRRANDNADDMVGQDSFLDVVTNIVGILILLVMVMGLRSGKEVATDASDPAAIAVREQEKKQELEEVYRTAVMTEQDLHDTIRRVYDTQDQSMMREQERLWLQQAVAEAEQALTEKRAKLDDKDQHKFDLRRQLSEAHLKLDELTQEQIALLNTKDIEEIQCEPTPVARSVTGKEAHLLLANDHLAFLPADDLINMMYSDFEQNSWRLRNENEMMRTIGPVGGFRLQYRFEVRDIVGQTRTGLTTSGRKAEFIGLYFLPTTTPIGEPAESALHSGSEFLARLAQIDATRTTITIWTYPGNYERLRDVRKLLREHGYQVALRPLPKGCPVGFSPNGSKSVSE